MFVSSQSYAGMFRLAGSSSFGLLPSFDLGEASITATAVRREVLQLQACAPLAPAQEVHYRLRGLEAGSGQ